MICNICRHKLPEDSEFCQYCGNKIERVLIQSKEEKNIEMSSDNLSYSDFSEKLIGLNFKEMSQEEAQKALFEILAEETMSTMEANSRSQPNNEDDSDFGIVPEKPIYTYGLKSVEGEKEYLNKLYTTSGEKITWSRRGSMSVDGVNGMVDIYDTYFSSGQLYKTIYINMYGVKEAEKAPKGFIFTHGKEMVQSKDLNLSFTSKEGILKRNIQLFSSIAICVFSLISIFSVIGAMNTQDSLRNYMENWDTTVVYFVLLSGFAVSLSFAIISIIRNDMRFLFGSFPVPLFIAIVTIIEGSIFSRGYYDYYKYVDYYNNDIVDSLNMVWVVCAAMILICGFIPICFNLFYKIKFKWYSNIIYREKCYKRVDKIRDYYEKGIISEEVYDREKKEILKNIM